MKAILLLGLFLSASQAQWIKYPTPGIPRTADGKPDLKAPSPRTADGKPDLSGIWSTASDRYYNNITVDLKPEDVLPWAEALHRTRMKTFGKDAMETLCLPLGPPAMIGPYRDFKFVQTPTLILAVLSDLTSRQIHMDGRQLEKDPNPSWMGYSVGHWDEDILVVDSNGYSPQVWLDWDGHPHTEELHITERYRRTDFGHMENRMTIEDPKAYAKPWTIVIPLELMADTEMLEYVCNENEKDRLHMDAKGREISDALLPEATLAKYAGRYEYKSSSGTAHPVEITTSNGALYWDEENSGKQRLYSFNETTFSLSGTEVEFVLSGGLATEMVIKMAEGNVKAERSK